MASLILAAKFCYAALLPDLYLYKLSFGYNFLERYRNIFYLKIKGNPVELGYSNSVLSDSRNK